MTRLTEMRCRIGSFVAAGRGHAKTTVRKRVRGRDGYLYVAVMLTAVLVGLIGLTSASVGRLHLQMAVGESSAGQAGILAGSAVEHGLAAIQNDDNWRTTYQHGSEYPATPVAMNGGTWTWKLIDDDGNLADDDSDFVRITGIGRFERTTIVESVTVYPTGIPLPVMGYALHGQKTVTLTRQVNVATNHVVSSNADIGGSGTAVIAGDAVATLGIVPGVNGSSTIGATPRRMPGSSVLDYYRIRGTSIPLMSLPQVDGVRTLEKIVLSRASNPYGATNAAGLYIIDCQDQTINIRNCRITGTVLLSGLGAGSSVSDSVRWESHLTGFPALLVDGSIDVNLTSTILSEALFNTNFNPDGTPYDSESDSDTGDTYPTGISGVVYVTGNLTIPASATATNVSGVVITGLDTTIQSSSTINYDSTSFAFPPPGFASGNPMRFIPGSHRREALP